MRNWFTKIITIVAVCFLILLAPQMTTWAADLDQIEEYLVKLEPSGDGSMIITYHISWKVLDSTTEGPLEWVKVGIPNQYVEELAPLSSSIKKIKYLSDNGDFVRIDLDRKYEQGETVQIDFRIHQHQLYQEENDYYWYEFTPGWFPDIRIQYMELKWKAQEGVETDLIESDGYYVNYLTDLEHDQKMTVYLQYPKSHFTFQDNYKEEVQSQVRSRMGTIMGVVYLGIPVGLVIWLLFRRSRKPMKDYYDEHSGMGYSYYHNRIRHTGSRGGGGGCACACACACAGGGRAGCSAKEFYSAKHWKLKGKNTERS